VRDIDSARNDDDNVRWDAWQDPHPMDRDDGDRQDEAYERYINEQLNESEG
jgi:hypothetical protein